MTLENGIWALISFHHEHSQGLHALASACRLLTAYSCRAPLASLHIVLFRVNCN